MARQLRKRKLYGTAIATVVLRSRRFRRSERFVARLVLSRAIARFRAGDYRRYRQRSARCQQRASFSIPWRLQRLS